MLARPHKLAHRHPFCGLPSLALVPQTWVGYERAVFMILAGAMTVESHWSGLTNTCSYLDSAQMIGTAG